MTAKREFVRPRDVGEAARSDPELLKALREDPVATLEGIRSPLETDKLVYRMVVLFLGAALLVSLGVSAYLAAVNKDVPQFVVAAGSGALGALAGLLAPSPGR